MANADGDAYATFLATLNGGTCFALQCDWRLPTRAELETIFSEPYQYDSLPLSTPCVDQVVFGPTAPDFYWTATTAPCAAASDRAIAVHVTPSEPSAVAPSPIR